MNDEEPRTKEERSDIQYSIEVHIEELALYGFAPSGRYRIADAVECELSRLLAERDVSPLLAKGSEMARLDGKPFHMPSGFKAETIGAQVAQTVYEGMMR